ncbi:DNA-processing protein DprA [Candidatus Saccharibacteria bacterium]|nr:DNA-processing protein DprA [Candidatus Saccharibacteria bacterium]
MNVNILKLNGPGYPEILRNIAWPPQQLYWAGVNPRSWLSKPKVTIVGSRNATPYGRGVTNKLASELASHGVVIISGLAYGVDIAAHQAALSVDGTTVAVLAGLERIYPSAHQHIANDIMKNGSLITEYGPGTNTYKSSFVARNRIVSGLADVLLITEAAVNSGSLHTARFALEQGKTVMAVPGNINSPLSEGCNNLIKSGAIPVTSVDDVFFALKLDPKAKNIQVVRSNPQEQLVFDLIKQGISAQDALAVGTKMNGPELASTLTMLELSGSIRPAGGGNWVVS